MEVSTAPVIATEAMRPLRRVEFEKLSLEGYFDDERVELLFGVIVPMSPVDAAHEQSAVEIAAILRAQLQIRACVRENHAFAASDISEPIPDVAVVPERAYWTTNPKRAHLVIEVARTSLPKDRGIKAVLYADGSVAEYWIVNHVDDCIEVFRNRRAGKWRQHTVYRRGETIHMLRFLDVAVAVGDVLPPKPRRRSVRRPRARR